MPHLEFSALTLLLVQIMAIVAASRLLGVVTRWLGQPLVIAEVLAGIVLGPSLLGLVWPAALGALFPPSSFEVLKMLSQVGLVLFMFLIGLELDPRLLRGRAHASILVSHTSIVLPFVLGAAAAPWLYGAYAPAGVPFLPFLLFLGVSMSVTAFPVLARILSERNLLGSRVGAITIACAAVDDVTAWCLLAFVVAVARAGAPPDGVWTTGLALAFVLAMLVLVRPFLVRLAARVASPEGVTPTAVAITLIGLIASSTVTEVIGIHALFGAFLFGAILPKEGHLAHALAEKLETVSVVLLLPLFFAFSGLRTEIGLVSGAEDWLVAGGLIVLATLGKFGGSALAARVTGMRWREATAIGILMNTRGLMELIVLNIGLDLGVISPTIFTMMVIMALVTTFATTPVLRWVYPERELARDRLEAARPSAEQPATYTVLMCVSHGAAGDGLVRLVAALLGRRDRPSRLYALHLARPTDRPSVDRRQQEVGPAVAPLAALARRAGELGLDVTPITFVSTEPGPDICRTADARRADLILLGWHKPLLLEGHLGGTVRSVLARTRQPVAVLVDRGLAKVARVLVAYVGGPEDLAAMRVARQLGEVAGSSLTLLHVVAPGPAPRTKRGRTQIDEVFAEPELDEARVRVRVIEHASPPDAVLEEAACGYDLVVVGMNARWGLAGGRMGLRRQRVLAEAPISVLAVHPPAAASAGPEREDGGGVDG